MKRRIIFFCMLILCGVTACTYSDVAGEKEKPEKQESAYGELEKEEELTVTEDTITVVLQENQALPYRWKSKIQGEAAESVSEETVTGKGSLFQSGDSPAYHVFTFRWVADGEVQLELSNVRISPPDDMELNGKRVWYLQRQNGIVTWELVETED
ncbi:MAG: protease inhibitor I42 family protein [Lachnospiraceae bacterium]|nr:protease inhibitor I42 family protein [Lachnospiraceae bacterium]